MVRVPERHGGEKMYDDRSRIGWPEPIGKPMTSLADRLDACCPCRTQQIKGCEQCDCKEDAIDRCFACVQPIHALAKEAGELENSRVKEYFCAYCQIVFPNDSGLQPLMEHVQTCDKHPLKLAQARVAELERAIAEHHRAFAIDPGQVCPCCKMLARREAALEGKEGNERRLVRRSEDSDR